MAAPQATGRVHDMGHVLSLLYDIPHGATLSVVYPAWMKRMKERIPERIAELGKNLFQCQFGRRNHSVL